MLDIMFSCARCGYDTNQKSNLKSHLTKQTKCLPTLCDIDPDVLVAELYIVKSKCQCEWCGKMLNSYQSKYIHKKNHCRVKRAQELAPEPEIAPEVIDTVMHIALSKPKKTEEDYQVVLQKYLKGKHKKLALGITDITTDAFHAEIKMWGCYKEAIGQLLAYNFNDPRENLHVYFFGKAPRSDLRKTVIAFIQSTHIRPFEIELTDQHLNIRDLLTETTEVAELHSL